MPSEDEVRSRLSDPIYAGIGPYPQLIDDNMWIEAQIPILQEQPNYHLAEIRARILSHADEFSIPPEIGRADWVDQSAKAIQRDGAPKFLKSLLTKLRQSAGVGPFPKPDKMPYGYALPSDNANVPAAVQHYLDGGVGGLEQAVLDPILTLGLGGYPKMKNITLEMWIAGVQSFIEEHGARETLDKIRAAVLNHRSEMALPAWVLDPNWPTMSLAMAEEMGWEKFLRALVKRLETELLAKTTETANQSQPSFRDKIARRLAEIPSHPSLDVALLGSSLSRAVAVEAGAVIRQIASQESTEGTRTLIDFGKIADASPLPLVPDREFFFEFRSDDAANQGRVKMTGVHVVPLATAQSSLWFPKMREARRIFREYPESYSLVAYFDEPGGGSVSKAGMFVGLDKQGRLVERVVFPTDPKGDQAASWNQSSAQIAWLGYLVFACFMRLNQHQATLKSVSPGHYALELVEQSHPVLSRDRMSATLLEAKPHADLTSAETVSLHTAGRIISRTIAIDLRPCMSEFLNLFADGVGGYNFEPLRDSDASWARAVPMLSEEGLFIDLDPAQVKVYPPGEMASNFESPLGILEALALHVAPTFDEMPLPPDVRAALNSCSESYGVTPWSIINGKADAWGQLAIVGLDRAGHITYRGVINTNEEAVDREKEVTLVMFLAQLAFSVAMLINQQRATLKGINVAARHYVLELTQPQQLGPAQPQQMPGAILYGNRATPPLIEIRKQTAREVTPDDVADVSSALKSQLFWWSDESPRGSKEHKVIMGRTADFAILFSRPAHQSPLEALRAIEDFEARRGIVLPAAITAACLIAAQGIESNIVLDRVSGAVACLAGFLDSFEQTIVLPLPQPLASKDRDRLAARFKPPASNLANLVDIFPKRPSDAARVLLHLARRVWDPDWMTEAVAASTDPIANGINNLGAGDLLLRKNTAVIISGVELRADTTKAFFISWSQVLELASQAIPADVVKFLCPDRRFPCANPATSGDGRVDILVDEQRRELVALASTLKRLAAENPAYAPLGMFRLAIPQDLSVLHQLEVASLMVVADPTGFWVRVCGATKPAEGVIFRWQSNRLQAIYDNVLSGDMVVLFDVVCSALWRDLRCQGPEVVPEESAQPARPSQPARQAPGPKRSKKGASVRQLPRHGAYLSGRRQWSTEPEREIIRKSAHGVSGFTRWLPEGHKRGSDRDQLASLHGIIIPDGKTWVEPFMTTGRQKAEADQQRTEEPSPTVIVSQGLAALVAWLPSSTKQPREDQ